MYRLPPKKIPPTKILIPPRRSLPPVVSSRGTRKCSYWEWFDPPICDRGKKIILGLLKKSNAKDEEIKILKIRTKQKQFGAFMIGFGATFVINIVIFVFLL
ncbi:unnamed protein product [Cuscuta campestris]|uniref:Uncharacterized protein n=1 Tax=Cuscuta campestris TaxID=132261 RepID=A0A484MKN8_9ASTE|nr:unnamed protein product [Cuscuta campestris]